MSYSRYALRVSVLLAAATSFVFAATATASSFSVASSPGTAVNGSNIMGQDFSPSVSTAPEDPSGYTATPSPQPAAGATVYLTSFQFTASNIYNGTQAAGNTQTYLIVEDDGPTSGYSNMSALTTATVTGVSTNAVDTTPADNTAGTPLIFNFNNLPVTYGDYFTAALATVSGTTITYIAADIQLVHFTQDTLGDANNGTYFPDTNYGGGQSISNESTTSSSADNYNAAALYTYGGSYFGAGSNAEDAVFTANFLTAVPEPASAAMVGLLALVLIGRRRTAML